MEQFVAYENKGAGKKAYPYLINMQHPVANVLNHSLVIPAISLWQLGTTPPKKICPMVMIAGNNCVALTHMMAGIPSKELGHAVQDLTIYRHTLRDTVDFLVNGY